MKYLLEKFTAIVQTNKLISEGLRIKGIFLKLEQKIYPHGEFSL